MHKCEHRCTHKCNLNNQKEEPELGIYVHKGLFTSVVKILTLAIEWEIRQQGHKGKGRPLCLPAVPGEGCLRGPHPGLETSLP